MDGKGLVLNILKEWFETSFIKEVWDDDIASCFEDEDYILGIGNLFLFLAVCFCVGLIVIFVIVSLVALCIVAPVFAIPLLAFLFTWIGVSVYLTYKNRKDNHV